MLVYGLELTEERHPCEFCGFPCFDDELVCPNCNKERVSLLSEEDSARKRQVADSTYKQAMFSRAAKRGRYLRLFFYAAFFLSIASFFFFITVEDHDYASSANDPAGFSIGVVVLLTAAPYLLLLGQPGTQCSRTISQLQKDRYSRFGNMTDFRRPKGLLRYIQDGVVAEFGYTLVMFIVITIVIAYWAEPIWFKTYLNQHVVIVSQELYVAIGMTVMYAVNTLMFLGYFLYNIFCPYDYQSELTSRLNLWNKHT